ncbi:hypothetical protein FHX77_000328 [Bifidobacterium commune]|uniref:Uncharacterized protein n=1 Tax=Bifidobacterium commune TaxID=1505727 RepID=A0A1C4H2R3_9BIFI|nr:hypothetical protein [Bifidobacterium commune]SCC79105.1 hypothetical protein GA0061077_0576 [Bifidobacterium commune]
MKQEKKTPADGQESTRARRNTGFIGRSKPEQHDRDSKEYGNPSEPQRKGSKTGIWDSSMDTGFPFAGWFCHSKPI